MDDLRVYLLYGSAPGDPDVWNGLDHLRFGMDWGYGSACGFRVWIGSGLYILTLTAICEEQCFRMFQIK